MYHFIDFNIHPAVFLGLHLLVTDPATSPRKNFGKAIFGAAYGAGVFVLYGLLDSLGAPTFYDKLLCVPVLNLTVRALDRASIALSAWLARQRWVTGAPAVAGAFGLDSATGEFWIHGDLGGSFWIHDSSRAFSAENTRAATPPSGKEPARRGTRKPAGSWPVLSTCSARATPPAVASLWECC